MRLRYTFIAAIVIAVALLYAGSVDAESAEKQQEVYCDMVKTKAWPDYNGNYDELCK